MQNRKTGLINVLCMGLLLCIGGGLYAQKTQTFVSPDAEWRMAGELFDMQQ